MTRRPHDHNATTGPEQYADRRPFTSQQVERSGGVSWFNHQQRAKTAELPSAMELAMQAAKSKAVRRG